MPDPWANLRGVPVPIGERCGANTRTKIGQCQNERDLCGLHPRIRRYPYKPRRSKPDGRTERARRNRAERQRAFDEMSAADARQREAETTRNIERAWRAADSSNPPENPGPQRGSAARSQSAAPPAWQSTRGRSRQPPAQDGAPLDGEPYRYRSARLRHLNPGERRRVAEREWEPPDRPPDGGEPMPVAA